MSLEDYYTKAYWQNKVEKFKREAVEGCHGAKEARLRHAEYVLRNGYVHYQLWDARFLKRTMTEANFAKLKHTPLK